MIVFGCILLFNFSHAQKKPPLPPAPSHQVHPNPRYNPPPAYNPETHQEIINDVNSVILNFQKINDSTVGIIESYDTTNRNILQPFPTIYLLAKVTYPDKPSENHTNITYINNFTIGSKRSFDLIKKNNKYIDYRTLYDFKKGTITALNTDKEGRKKAGSFSFSTINLAPDGTAKAFNINTGNEPNSITETDEMKTISGFYCRKYIKTGEGSIMEIWTTLDSTIYSPELTDPLLKSFFCVSAPVVNTFSDFKSVLMGVPVQLVFLPKNKFSLKCTITYEKIERNITDEAFFKTDGYEVHELHTLQEIFNSRD